MLLDTTPASPVAAHRRSILADTVLASSLDGATLGHLTSRICAETGGNCSFKIQDKPCSEACDAQGSCPAVLAGGAPQNRIGIVAMATGEVIRWIPTTQPVGIVRFSPDGTKLLATTYDGAPGDRNNAAVTGFILVDLRTGYLTVVSQGVGVQRSFPAGAYWTYNVAYIYIVNYAENASAWFFTPDGHATATPAHAQALTFNGGYGADVSPNGLLANTDSGAGTGTTPQTSVENLATGEVVGTQPVEDLQGWADNDELIAWGCGPGCPNENHQRLVLVSVDGKHITPLSGFVHGHTDVSPGQWRVLLTRR